MLHQEGHMGLLAVGDLSWNKKLSPAPINTFSPSCALPEFQKGWPAASLPLFQAMPLPKATGYF